MKKITTVFLIIVLTLALTACSSGGEGSETEETAKSFPMTVTDYLGTEMEFTEAPQRIASLSPSCTEILFALGLGDQVVEFPTGALIRKRHRALKKSGTPTAEMWRRSLSSKPMSSLYPDRLRQTPYPLSTKPELTSILSELRIWTAFTKASRM